jgi:Family of unknown function (DUF6982)
MIVRRYTPASSAGCLLEREGVDSVTMETNPACSTRVVVQCGTKTVKGFLDSPAWHSLEDLLRNAPRGIPTTFRVRRLDSGAVEEIPAEQVKAVFYVESFEGNSDRKDLRFHSRAPIVCGIWMRLQFTDGEVMEGIVYNSIRYLIDPGFFVLPTDPGSNNKMVYVAKSALTDLRILGLRKLDDGGSSVQDRVGQDFCRNSI